MAAYNYYAQGLPDPKDTLTNIDFEQQTIVYDRTGKVELARLGSLRRELVKFDQIPGEMLDAVVGAGANQMNGIGFRVEESEKLLDEARKRAVAEARRKAEQLAGELGVVLGAPLRVSEGGGFLPPPQPMMGRAMMMAAPESVPVSPGEQELSVTVQVVFEITRPE